MASVDTFRGIRAWDDRRDRSFEHLAYQIREAAPTGSRTVKTGDPDSGFEWYTTLADGSVWGAQAKFYLGDDIGPLLGAMGESLAEAVGSEPKLTRYTFYVPVDLPDERDRGTAKRRPRQSQRDRYRDAERRWRRDLGLVDDFEIVLKTGGDILARLVRPEFAGVRAFWWDEHVLDLEWCSERLRWAQAASSSRYDPNLGVPVPVDGALDVFRLRRGWDEATWRSWLNVRADASALASSGGNLPGEILSALVALASAPDCQEALLDSLAPVREAVLVGIDSGVAVASADQGTGRAAVRSAVDTLRRARDLLTAPRPSIAASNALLLHGDGGAGKSHTLFTAARRCLDDRQPVVFLLGSRYAGGDLWSGTTGQLGLDTMQSDEFLGMLNAASDAYGRPLLLVIDALNESRRPEFWHTELAVLREAIKKYPGIRICASVKDVYLDFLDPDGRLSTEWAFVRHWGFKGDVETAVAAYFNHYDIHAPSDYRPWPEFANPLFLKLFCQGLSDAGEHVPPTEDEDLWNVYERYLAGREGVICQALLVPPARRPVRRAVAAIADRMAASGSDWVGRNEADELVRTVLPEHGDWPNGLFGRLLGENVLVDDLLGAHTTRDAAVRFSYNGLSDYLISRSIVEKAVAAGTVDRSLLVPQLRSADVGLTSTLARMLAETMGLELAALAAGETDQDEILLRAVIDALPTLSRTVAGPATWSAVRRAIATLPSPAFDAILVSAAEGSDEAALVLHETLRTRPMASRDSLWSVYAVAGEWEAPIGVGAIFDAARDATVREPGADEQRRLSLVLPWLMTSPDNGIRETAGRLLAAIWSLRLECAADAIEEFAGVDDANVTSGVLTAAYGAVLRGGSGSNVPALSVVRAARAAAEVYQYCDDVARDAVDGLVEWAARASGRAPVAMRSGGTIPVPVLVRWASEPPALPPSEDALEERHGEGFNSIRYSLLGMGDFGRYVVEARLRRVRVAGPEWTDANVAGRWILERVAQLGWTPKLFRETDRAIPSNDGRSSRRVERVGKKYQWIALRELMARLVDTFGSDPDEGPAKPYAYFGRDYDPSFGPLWGSTPGDDSLAAWWTTGTPVPVDGPDADWMGSWVGPPTAEADVRLLDAAGTAWVALSRYSDRSSPPQEGGADQRGASFGPIHRNEWHMLWAWIVSRRDAARIARYLNGRTLWGRWMPEEPEHIDGAYLGEVPWASAAALDSVWGRPWRASRWPRGLLVVPSVEAYLWEANVRDHTLRESSRATVPARPLFDEGGLDWVGGRTEWESDGRLVARFVQAADGERDRERALLVREDWLRPLLDRLDLALVWGSLRGRQVLGGSFDEVRGRPEAAIDGRGLLAHEWEFAPTALRVRGPDHTTWGRPRRAKRVPRHNPPLTRARRYD